MMYQTRTAERSTPTPIPQVHSPALPVRALNPEFYWQRYAGNRAVAAHAARNGGANGAASDPQVAAPSVNHALSSSGHPLDTLTRAEFEPRLRRNLSDVRIHTGAAAAQSLRDVGAQAYTVGQHIVTQQYTPGTAAGRHLLAHEMMHTMQQGKRAPSAHMPVFGADHASEREAGRAVRSVFAGATPHITPITQPAVQRTIFPIMINPTERRRVYSGTASPGPGIQLSWTGSVLSIRARMEISGPLATAALAAQIKTTIERYWNASFSDGYRVSCNVDVRNRASGATADPAATQIEIVNEAGPSNVRRYWLVGQRFMTYNLDANSNINWTPAHEFGHLLGLDDRYSESVVSRIRGQFGGRRETPADPGWSGNIMAEVGGIVESKNVMDLLTLYAYEYVPVPLLGPAPADTTA